MTFKVCWVEDTPNYESLPVAKIINYPLETRDYKPFAQNRICVNGEAFFVRMWAFEVSPGQGSELRCVLYLYPHEPELAFCISAVVPAEGAGADGRNQTALFLLRDGVEVPGSRQDAREYAHPYNGEDLQGVYWGETFSIPLEKIAALGGGSPNATIGQVFPGNFYKLCDDGDFAHRGCYYTTDFKRTPFGRNNMGSFEVVPY